MKEQFNKVLNDISNIVGRNKSFNHKLKNGLFNIYWGIKVNNMLDFKIVYVLNKIIELIKLGHTITILIADIHTILNNTNIAIETETNKFITNLWKMIDSFNLTEEESTKINIIKGSEFQLDSNYILDMYKLISIHGSIKDYCNEFDLDINNISFNNILDPILQTLDEEHIKKNTSNEIDCQIGYSHNLKQHSFSKKSMVKLGYKAKTYILYKIPTILITNPIYINSSNFISMIYTLNTETLDFIINTLLDNAKLKKIWPDEEIEKDRTLLNTMTIDNKCDIIIKLKQNLF
jgi:tyrosyl-tRNA synthetase